ncbi:MAG: GTPase HflX [Candidatus Neomarinimicrobiota bacterium]
MQPAKERAILVGVRWGSAGRNVADEHLLELRELVETAGGEVAGEVVQHRARPVAATLIGKGKAETTVHQARALDCNLIVFDDDLSPTQQKTLQDLAGDSIKVIDRSALIIDIFSRHARTREAKTQVELARLQYLLPRLTRQWTHLERQMGGIGTRGGPGEAQIEVDRRLIRNRIKALTRDLKRIAAERATQSRQRRQTFRVALVGYTNAGKSTLMNALTDAGAQVEDRLFATLDTTTRRMSLGGSHPILLSDTVGFIRKLPHHLIASFRSTLAEVADADLLLKVTDASAPQALEHVEVIAGVLEDLGLGEKPSVVVLNKLDAVDTPGILTGLERQIPGAVIVSARQRLRLDHLEGAILEAYSRDFDHCELRIPTGQSQLISSVYETLSVEERVFENESTVLTVSGPRAAINAIRERIQ